MDNRKILAASFLVRRANLKGLIRLSGVRAVFPFYHTVTPEPLPHLSNLYHTRSAKEFESDLDELLRWFEPVALGEYLNIEDPDKRRKVMVITFDDGLAECYRLIAPLLVRKGVPAVFFLNNNFIGNRDLFYRYKASILIQRLRAGSKERQKAADFLAVPEKSITDKILAINYNQGSELDQLAARLEVDFQEYMTNRPVYMNPEQISELVKWGFELGGHSPDHADFSALKPEEMINQVRESIDDLQRRFSISTRYFSFPFTSYGVPGHVIEALLSKRIAEVLMGTSGMKNTGRAGLIQRIPMEGFEQSAMNVIKAEYLYYLIKAPLGRNRY